MASGYLACASCEQTSLRAATVAAPDGPQPAMALIAAAQEDSLRRVGRGLGRDDLERLLRWHPDSDRPATRLRERSPQSTEGIVVKGPSDEIRGVVDRLLDLREAEGPLGDTGYRGPFTQKVIAKIAGVPVKTVTAMAIERDRRRAEGESL